MSIHWTAVEATTYIFGSTCSVNWKLGIQSALSVDPSWSRTCTHGHFMTKPWQTALSARTGRRSLARVHPTSRSPLRTITCEVHVLEHVRADIRRALRGNQHATGATAILRELLNPGTQAVLVYRWGKWIDGVRLPGVRHLLKIAFMLVQYVVSWRVGIFIPVKADIGPGLLIHAWGGGIFLPAAKIGRNLTIIGGGVQFDYETKEIGDDVSIAPGTKGIGKISIGSRVRTGPNSVVQTDVPDDCVVVMSPCRVIGPVPRLTYEEGARRIVPKARAGHTESSPTKNAP